MENLHSAPPSDRTLSRRDLALGTVIAVLTGTVFFTLGSGASLLVTFVPGVVFTWATFVFLYAKRIELPSHGDFLTILLLVFASPLAFLR